MLLADLGACAACGEDIGRAAFDRASDLLCASSTRPAPATHHLVCSVPTAPETLLAVLHADDDADGATAQLDEAEALEFTTVLAVGIATAEPRRTRHAHQRPRTPPDRVYGWRLRGDGLGR